MSTLISENLESEVNKNVANGHSWVFSLFINNTTDRDFKVKQKELFVGRWYTDGKDNKKPVTIPAGQNIQVFGVRASDGTWTGYEAECTWIDEAPSGEKSYGTIHLRVNVPYSSNNESELTVSALLDQEGWEKIPKKGHSFSRSITISMIGDKIVASDQNNFVEIRDEEYENCLMQEINNNDLMNNWDVLQKLSVQEPFDPNQYIPKTVEYPPKQRFVARSETMNIPKTEWSGISDPIYHSHYSQNELIEEYFAVAAYSINSNAREYQSIPKGVDVTKVSSIEVGCSIKYTLEKNQSIKETLTGSYANKKVGMEIKNQLESQFSQRDVFEKSTSRIEQRTQTIHIGAANDDRTFVPWVFSQTILLYRKPKNKPVSLVGIAEWTDLVLYKTYS